MTDTRQTPLVTSTRDEKLRAIATVFGEAVANRISPANTSRQTHDPDRERLAWQTNRLIQHLRDRTDHDPKPVAQPPKPRRPDQMPVLAAGEDLAAEHPAVIAYLLKSEDQQVRVSVLRALPGQVARAVMRRLRST